MSRSTRAISFSMNGSGAAARRHELLMNDLAVEVAKRNRRPRHANINADDANLLGAQAEQSRLTPAIRRRDALLDDQPFLNEPAGDNRDGADPQAGGAGDLKRRVP